MSDDIRLSTSMPANHKVKKLRRRLNGDGLWSLIVLVMYARDNRPDGVLTSMDPEDIEIAADWQGEPGALFSALTDLGFLDHDAGLFSIHDWAEHQPWAAGAKERSEAASRAAKERWSRRNNATANSGARKGKSPADTEQHAETPESDAGRMQSDAGRIEMDAGSADAQCPISIPIPIPIPIPNPISASNHEGGSGTPAASAPVPVGYAMTRLTNHGMHFSRTANAKDRELIASWQAKGVTVETFEAALAKASKARRDSKQPGELYPRHVAAFLFGHAEAPAATPTALADELAKRRRARDASGGAA